MHIDATFSQILGYWVHNLDPFAIRFSNGFFLEGIRWYGISYVMGFLIAIALLYFYHKKGRSPYDTDQQSTLMTAIIVGTLVGGRLGYMLLYDFHDFIHNPLTFFMTLQGGMASHGGIIGVMLAIYWFAKHTKTSFLGVCDLIATIAPAGLFFGRIANFINGELWGKVSYVSWAVIFPSSVPPGYPLESIPPRHPSQLYEAGLEGLFLFVYLQLRFWINGKTLPKGRLAGEFFIGYALSRIFCEFFREPDGSLILGISRGQFYSVFLIVIGILFIYFSQKFKTHSGSI